MSKARNIADLGSNDVLDTTASGISITGEVASDTLTINGGTNFTAPIEFMGNDTNWAVAVQNGTTTGASYGLVVRAGTNTNDISFETRDADNNKSLRVSGNGDIIMYKDDGSTSGFEYDASTANVTVNGDIKLTETGDTTQSLTFQQVGGASFIKPKSGSNDGELYISGGQTATNRMKVTTGGDIIMYKSDGSTAGMTFDASAGSIAIGTTNLPSDVSVVAADGIKVDVGTSDTTRIYAKSSGTGAYSLGTSGGSAIAFHRLSDNSDEIGFETHHAGNNHTERMRLNYHGQLTLEGTGQSFDTTPSKNGLQLYYETDSGIATIGSYSSGGGTVLDFRANSGGLAADANAMRIGSNYVTVNPDSNAHDFIVKSDTNANMLFVDGGNNYVSLGTNATDIGSSSSGEGVTYRNGESLRVQRASGSPIIANRVTDDGSIIDFRKNGAGVGSVGVDSGKLTLNSGGSNLVFQTGGTSRVNMDSSQMYPQTDGAMSLGHPSVRWNNLRLTGSINFDSSSAGLDAYEEGTWTAYVSDVNGNNPVSGGTMGYVRIGNVMYLFGQASFVNVNAYIGGSQAYLHTPTAPRNAFAQSSNDVLIPFWHSGAAASLDYWSGGYPSISMNTGNTRHPIFRHKYNGADAISGANLGSGDFRVNFNGFFYYE